MPRAATSVATSTSILPLRNARNACSPAPWPRSPWTAAAANPRSPGLRRPRPRCAWCGRTPWSGHGRRPAGRARASRPCPARARGTRAGSSRHRRQLGWVLGPDVHRATHVPAGQSHDLGRHRRGEEQRLPRGRVRARILSTSGGSRGRASCPPRRGPGPRSRIGRDVLLDQVEEAARCPDDDVDAGAQCVHLRLVRPAAVDREDARSDGPTSENEITGHLHARARG